MNPLQSINSIQALAFIACQPVNGYGMCYLKETQLKGGKDVPAPKEGELEAKGEAEVKGGAEKTEQTRFQDLVKDALKSSKNELDKRTVYAALTCMQARVSKLAHPSIITMLIQTIWSLICGTKKETVQYTEIENYIKQVLSKNFEEEPKKFKSANYCPETHLEALCTFMKGFEKEFGVTPPPMKGAEIYKFFVVTKRIWESEDVQRLTEPKFKYNHFRELMAELVIGSHFQFFEPMFKSIDNSAVETVKSPYYVRHNTLTYQIKGSMFEQDHYYEGSILHHEMQNRNAMYKDWGMSVMEDWQTYERHRNETMYWPSNTIDVVKEINGFKECRITWMQYRTRASEGISGLAFSIIRKLAFMLGLGGNIERTQYSGYNWKTQGWIPLRGRDYNHPIMIQPRKTPVDSQEPTKTDYTWTVSNAYRAMPK